MPLPNQVPKMQFPGMDPVFQKHYDQLTDTVNTLLGHNGPIQLANHLDLGGNRIMNVGAPTATTDAISSLVAQSRYSPTALKPYFESGGKNAFVGYRQINNQGQREQTSSWLNQLLSTPPNSNSIDPITSTSGGSTTVTIPASIYRFADGTKWFLPSRSDTITNPVSINITTFTVSGNVATVNLASAPSPPFTSTTVVFISGTGEIDGTYQIASIISPTSFTVVVTGGVSGTGGTVTSGGTAYYYISKKFRRVLLATLPSSSDTPFNRLSVSTDSLQLVAVVGVNADGSVREGTAGGGTPTSTANAGSRF